MNKKTKLLIAAASIVLVAFWSESNAEPEWTSVDGAVAAKIVFECTGLDLTKEDGLTAFAGLSSEALHHVRRCLGARVIVLASDWGWENFVLEIKPDELPKLPSPKKKRP